MHTATAYKDELNFHEQISKNTLEMFNNEFIQYNVTQNRTERARTDEQQINNNAGYTDHIHKSFIKILLFGYILALKL